MARPSKYRPDVVERIERAISAGATYRLACGYAGISEDTFSAWRVRYPDFAEMLTRAEAAAALRWLARIEQAGTDDWRALAWKLERRFPAEYGRQVQQVEQHVTGHLSATVDATVTQLDSARATIRERLTDDDADRLTRRLLG